MSDTSKKAKIIKRWYHSPSHRLTVNMLLNDITFLWFLLFSMCHSLHVAINKCINWCFVHLLLCIVDTDCAEYRPSSTSASPRLQVGGRQRHKSPRDRAAPYNPRYTILSGALERGPSSAAATSPVLPASLLLLLLLYTAAPLTRHFTSSAVGSTCCDVKLYRDWVYWDTQLIVVVSGVVLGEQGTIPYYKFWVVEKCFLSKNFRQNNENLLLKKIPILPYDTIR